MIKASRNEFMRGDLSLKFLGMNNLGKSIAVVNIVIRRIIQAGIKETLPGCIKWADLFIKRNPSVLFIIPYELV